MTHPNLHGIKSCMFTSRLVCYHESFVPLGKQQKKKHPRQTKAVVWQEAISGRLGSDVASAFVKAILDMPQPPYVDSSGDVTSFSMRNWRRETIRYVKLANPKADIGSLVEELKSKGLLLLDRHDNPYCLHCS